jgi:hypothetical protein
MVFIFENMEKSKLVPKISRDFKLVVGFSILTKLNRLYTYFKLILIST